MNIACKKLHDGRLGTSKPQDDNAEERQSLTQSLCSTVKSLLNLVLRPSIGLSSYYLNCDGCPLRVTGLARKNPATRFRDEACFAQIHPERLVADLFTLHTSQLDYQNRLTMGQQQARHCEGSPL